MCVSTLSKLWLSNTNGICMHGNARHVLRYSVTDRYNQIQAEDGSADSARAESIIREENVQHEMTRPSAT